MLFQARGLSAIVRAVLSRVEASTAPRREPLFTAASAVIIVVAAATALPHNYRLPKQDFTGAMSYVEAVRAPGDEIVAVHPANDVFLAYYRKPWHGVATAAEAERPLQRHGSRKPIRMPT